MSSNTKVNSKQLVLISPVELVNRYQPQRTIPKPIYTSVLAVGPVSPNQMIPFKYPYQSPTTRTDYVLKPHSTNIFAIESIHKNIHDQLSKSEHIFSYMAFYSFTSRKVLSFSTKIFLLNISQ